MRRARQAPSIVGLPEEVARALTIALVRDPVHVCEALLRARDVLGGEWPRVRDAVVCALG